MNPNVKRSLIAGLYGNALEWYDFLLYASFAPVFAKFFFPTDVPFISLLVTFSVFAIGFIMRPIGGALIGHYADHAGRRKALILSITVMTAATSAIAFLPDYQKMGLLSPILFTLMRLIQGIAVGGELPGSATYIIEHMLSHRRGLAGSLVLCTAFLGIFMGSLTSSLLSNMMSYEALSQWGWRLAYILGGVLGLLGIHLRIRSPESPAFMEVTPGQELPVKRLATHYKIPLFMAVSLTSIMALGNYMLIAFMTTFLVEFQGLSLNDALFINLTALFLLTVLIPLMGWLSDLWGRKPVILIGIIGLVIMSFPIFLLLLSEKWALVFLSEVLLCICLAPINATVPTILTELFPTSVRASGTSIGYNIGQAIFGGTLPIVALTLIHITGSKMAPAWYLFLWAVLVMIISRFFKESYQNSL